MTPSYYKSSGRKCDSSNHYECTGRVYPGENCPKCGVHHVAAERTYIRERHTCGFTICGTCRKPWFPSGSCDCEH